MGPLLEIFRLALVFAIILPVLIAVHELGHFWVARRFGMEVDSFAVFVGGVRRTKLDHLLKKPLAPPSRVWSFALVAFGTLIAGVTVPNTTVTVIGLALVGLALPLWIVTRIGALYLLPPSAPLLTLGKTWLGATLLTLLGNRMQGFNGLQYLGLITLASLVGILIVYYYPVLHKPEDAPHGHGQIEAGPGHNSTTMPTPDAEVANPTTEKIPVLFRPILSRKDKRGTEFSLLCWPLGGFAAIRGMQPKEDGSETRIPGGFYSKSPFARLMVLFAGPLFSIVFGVVVLTSQLMVTGETVNSTKPVIGWLAEDSPAAKAGLKVGDRVLTVNGEPVNVFFDVVQEVRDSVTKVQGEYRPLPVSLEIARGAGVIPVTVVPTVDQEPSAVLDSEMQPTKKTAVQAKLGIRPLEEHRKLAFDRALGLAAGAPIAMVAGLASTVTKPAEISKNVGGPGMIAKQVSEAYKRGIAETIQIAGLLSISLGVMNLLPIGPLDGGQMMVAFAELLRGGRRLSYKIQMTISTIGALLVMALILGVVTLDIGHFGGR